MNTPEKIFDAMLVLEYQSGSKKALALLVKRWHPKFYRQARWYIKDEALAKDVVQDSWSIVIKRLHSLKDPNAFGSWALTIVTRKSIDQLRKSKREYAHVSMIQEHARDTIEQPSLDKPNDLMQVLRRSIKELPQDNQIVLNLFYLEELSIKQIGNILNVPEGTIKSRLFNAREKLKVIIKNNHYEN